MRAFRLVAFGLLVATASLSCSSNTDSSSNLSEAEHSGSVSRVGNKDSKVFHTPSCRYVTAGLKHPVNFSSREEAIRAGYSPDGSGACHP